MTEIPEEHRRKALLAALYHHDGIDGRYGGDHEGATVTVEFVPDGHPDHVDGTREYIRTVAGALGYSYTGRGPFEADLHPDTEHALATLRGL